MQPFLKMLFRLIPSRVKPAFSSTPREARLVENEYSVYKVHTFR